MSEYNPYWKEEIVLTSAIYYDDGKEHPHQPSNIRSGFVITGHRHHNCLTTAFILAVDKKLLKNQGFITTSNVYLTRQEAMRLAKEKGQIKDNNKDMLFSEDLY